MSFPHSSLDNSMRYLQKRSTGHYELRIYVRELGKKIGCGTFSDLKEAQEARDKAERKYISREPYIKPWNPCTNSKQLSDTKLYDSAI